MASHLNYLTVQDILWINLQVTEKVQPYNFAKLEEATYYQYSYGASSGVVPQAARFLLGFPRMRPFDAGNDATTFVACLGFLRVNGYAASLSDGEAPDWYGAVRTKKREAKAALEAVVKSSEGHTDDPDVRKVIKDLLAEYPGTLASFAKPD